MTTPKTPDTDPVVSNFTLPTVQPRSRSHAKRLVAQTGQSLTLWCTPCGKTWEWYKTDPLCCPTCKTIYSTSRPGQPLH